MSDSNNSNRQIADLQEARAQSHVDIPLLTCFIWDTGKREKVDAIVKILEREPVFDKEAKRHMSRSELLQRAYAAQLRFVQLQKEHDWDHETLILAISLLEDQIPFGLHFNAFIPVLKSQGSDEQIAKWLPRCLSYELIGCYAQTELGHGSNVQGLETTATYHSDSQQFYINSPSLTSTKWWAGGLGTMANIAVVQALLIVAGKSYGPHLFVVPLRSTKDHRPFPGIKIGDIGPKSYGGFDSNDNGYARFTNVAIPHDHFLSRYAYLSLDGTYQAARHAKVGYGSMVALRASMPENLGFELAKCVTIACRYTTVRRQFSDASGEEKQVIRYSSVKHRLVPLLARSYAYIFAGKRMNVLYKTMLAELVAPPHDATLLSEVHVLSAGLKAVISWDAVSGMEEARKSMGGHGFSIYSGAGEKFAVNVPGQTYEGDNYVLVQQTAKGLMKSLDLVAQSKSKSTLGLGLETLPQSQKFLSAIGERYRVEGTKTVDWTDVDLQIHVLAHRATRLVAQLREASTRDRWDTLNMDCVRVTRAFVDHFTLSAFLDAIKTQRDPILTPLLCELASVYGLSLLLTSVPDLAELDMITASQIKTMKSRYAASMDRVARSVIGLTDAFGFSDYELNAVLGRKDGNVYEELWRAVQRNPINSLRREEVVGDYEAYIRPLMSFHATLPLSKL